MRNDYPAYYQHISELMEKLGGDAPSVMEGFAQMHEASVADGALSPKVKELIALAIGISVRCDGCIAYHIHDALQAGATRAEIADAVGVAVMMGGGPSVVYGSQAMEALEEFEALGV